MTGRRASLLGLVLAPLPALAMGLIVMARAGVPPALWLSNLAATIAGVLLVLGSSSRPSPAESGDAWCRWLIVIGLGLLGATLIATDMDGVHRWLGLGPLNIHVGAVLLPWLIVSLTRVDWAHSVAVAVLTLTVLLLQPDAAQAASFAAGWSVSAAMTRRRAAAGPIVIAVVLAGATWLRPDQLQAVPHVEGILGVAAAQGPLWTAASSMALPLLPIAFLLVPNRRVGRPLAVYVTGTLVAPWVGNYPVPVLGYGVAPILGYYLGVVALVRCGEGRSQSVVPAQHSSHRAFSGTARR